MSSKVKTILKWVGIALVLVGVAILAVVGIPEKNVTAIVAAVFVLVGLIVGLVAHGAQIKAKVKGLCDLNKDGKVNLSDLCQVFGIKTMPQPQASSQAHTTSATGQ
jgi:uncharacterized membrane protein YhaH (DUF805 family)